MTVRPALVVVFLLAGFLGLAGQSEAQTTSGPRVLLVPYMTSPVKAGPGFAAWPIPLPSEHFPPVQTPNHIPPNQMFPSPMLGGLPPMSSVAPGAVGSNSTMALGGPQPGMYMGESVPLQPDRIVDAKPIPFSLEDQIQKDYANRQALRYNVWDGSAVTAFPSNLLWEPPLASLREPRLALIGSSLANYQNSKSYDATIGATAGLFRVDPIGTDFSFQLDLFGNVISRLTPEELMVSEYRFGLPLTARWGDWHAKLAYERTASHLGDSSIINLAFTPIVYTRDEAVFGIGRWMWNLLRVYGQVSYAFHNDTPTPGKRERYDLGFEVYDRCACGISGTPFGAVNLDFRAESSYNTNFSAQAGWMWRNPYQRLASFRIFGQYYSGDSQYGQFSMTKENYYGVGVAGDF